MANWLTFKDIAKCEEIPFTGFQYDEVLDADIQAALADAETLQRVKTTIDWEDDAFLHESEVIPEDKKHAYRIAALVSELKAGGQIQNPIEMDTFTMHKCLSCVYNGHHRIRALQFLGLTCGPFSMSGDLDILENIVAVAGTVWPSQKHHYFADALLESSEQDIVVLDGNGMEP